MKPDLKQKMNQATGKGYVPAVIPPPDKDEPAPDIREFITDRKELNTLATLIDLHKQYGDAEKEAKKLKAPLTTQIKNILGANEVRRAICNGIPINYYNVPRTSIKLELLKDYLDDETIAKCTVTTLTPTLRIGGERGDD